MIGWLARTHRDGRNPDFFGDEDPGRLQIFVPAVMSAGVLFSVATLLRDAFERRGHRGRERRLWLTGQALASEALGEHAVTPAGAGLRPRRLYGVVGLAGLGTALYLTPGSTLNYLRDGGYVHHIAWLLAVSLLSAAGLGLLGVAAAMVYRAWPSPPMWTQRILLMTPLTYRPSDDGATWRGPSLMLSASLLVTTVSLWLLTVNVAASRFVVEQLDGWVARLVDSRPFTGSLRPLEFLGTTELAFVLVVMIGLATLRCQPFAAAYAGSVVAGLLASNGLKWIVDRPRPAGGPLAGFDDSFPSAHLVQGTLVAVLVPLAVLVLTRRRALGRLAGVVLAFGVAAVSVQRLADETHYASDVLGGVLAGLMLGLAARWVVGHERWHVRCRSCPWHRAEESADAAGGPQPEV